MSFTGLYEKYSKIKGFSAAGILAKGGSGLNLDDKDLRYITILYRLNG